MFGKSEAHNVNNNLLINGVFQSIVTHCDDLGNLTACSLSNFETPGRSLDIKNDHHEVVYQI